MKLSENTVAILKNYATINQGLVVKPGKTLRTISSNKAILAQAEVDEEFPHEFGIYDLNKSLSLLSMNKGADPEVEIEKEFFVFRGLAGQGKIRQRFTPTNLILAPPNKEINAVYDVEFNLTAETLNWIFSVASILKCPNIVVKSDGGDISIWAMDVKGEIVDDATAKVDGKSDVKFQAVLKIDNLKVLPGSYKVELSSIGVSKFTHSNKKLSYWIALEQNSSNFGG